MNQQGACQKVFNNGKERNTRKSNILRTVMPVQGTPLMVNMRSQKIIFVIRSLQGFKFTTKTDYLNV